MRRTLVLLVASIAVLGTAPVVAQAHHHRSREFRHHHRRHHHHHARRVHHARIRHKRFGADPTTSGNGGEQSAGTVASFSNGVLTIMLNDGSMVSGSVTGDTKLECAPASTNTQGEDGNDDGDNGQNSGDGRDSNNNDRLSGSRDDGNGSGNSGDGDDQGEDAQMCPTSALSAGTPVSEADLKITNAGAIWQEVELITS
jgi:hypothetical protein